MVILVAIRFNPDIWLEEGNSSWVGVESWGGEFGDLSESNSWGMNSIMSDTWSVPE